MPKKDIFDKPFDEGTLAKLEIFQEYFDEWLPTFIMGPFKRPIQVFDLFAGSGYDKNEIPGSPIRLLEIINKHRGNLAHKGKQVLIYLNDADKDKVEKLKLNVDKKIKALSLKSLVIMKYSNFKFNECLVKEYSKELKNGCNLIFIDQNGFKEVDEEVFTYLINLDTTEFLFFISSTFIHRFVEQDEVKKYHPKFNSEKIKHTPRKQIHNIICNEFEKYVPSNIKSYGLIPFSIMKDDNSNIYGLIFVSKHIRGADKFLHTVWKANTINGNANFDIDDDSAKNQLDIFDDIIPTKIESFQNKVRQLTLDGTMKTNRDVYLFTLNQGHIGKHSSEEVKRMKKEKLITYNSTSPLINYEMIYNKERILEFKLIKNETN